MKTTKVTGLQWILEMNTRNEMMADKTLHHAYYSEIANEAAVHIGSELLEKCHQSND
jgi:hypothetical protein